MLLEYFLWYRHKYSFYRNLTNTAPRLLVSHLEPSNEKGVKTAVISSARGRRGFDDFFYLYQSE